MSQVRDVTDSEFDAEVLKSDLPVLVDFWAEWCGPCKMVSPIVEELSIEYTNRVKFTKLDVDSNVQTSASYGIRSIPTLLVFKNGKVVGQIIGAKPKESIRAKLEEIIA